MLSCHAAWSRRTLTFQQLQDLLDMWFLETEDEERLFHNMARELNQRDRIIEYNQEYELQAVHRIIDCQVFDICCELQPLQDAVCCMESQTCCPPFVDCQKLNLYSMVESLFVKINNMATEAEELSCLLNTQLFLYKITSALSLDERILRGILTRTEQIEDVLLCITQHHQYFPYVSPVTCL
ncbi:uncharacterized protein LOC124366997 isoform X3 [Homalodisca vitripennis]|uniref:uncharacterized protein LOC124366997 isoform X3 n=1 Tax=Homalodisca vitripennis TaxID=197043 RepID=UPI001EEC7A75|nr:uncharacterized protein LOC124366997 isoform X3 [Homalodisca vitripennis]